MPTAGDIKTIFLHQQLHAVSLRKSGYKSRLELLNRLEESLTRHRPQIYSALQKDLNKSEMEADLTELIPVIKEIHFAKSKLREWTSPFPVATPLVLTGSSSFYQYEPKGVCLIISPWNYPINLTIGPLVAALAAGNTVILKPSERCPACGEVLKQIIESAFQPQEASLFLGDSSLGSQLLEFPFNHIFFTGSANTGKKILEKAAQHLSSTTLELGGKSPTIIDRSANIKKAAHRVAWSKMINNGQTCIAPDYILVEHSIKEAFIGALKKEVDAYFEKDASGVCKLIDETHREKMEAFIRDLSPETIRIPLTDKNRQGQFAPLLIIEPPAQSLLMQEEIFGPLLPLVSFGELEEAIAFIQSKPKPLSIYLYSSNKKNIRRVLTQTSSGGMVVNMGLTHFANPHLPFGGVNQSGIGKGHGFYGFQAFSNQKSVLKQILPIGPAELFAPPYKKWKQRLLKWIMKYL